MPHPLIAIAGDINPQRTLDPPPKDGRYVLSCLLAEQRRAQLLEDSPGTQVGRAASDARQPPAVSAPTASPPTPSTASAAVARPSPDANVPVNRQLLLPKRNTTPVAAPNAAATQPATSSTLNSRTQSDAGASRAPASSLRR